MIKIMQHIIYISYLQAAANMWQKVNNLTDTLLYLLPHF